MIRISLRPFGSNGDGTWWISNWVISTLCFGLPILFTLLVASCVSTAIDRKNKIADEHIREIVRTELKRQMP